MQVSLFDGTHRLGEVHGLHGLPAPRRIIRSRPGAHGDINQTRHYASRQPVWNGQLLGQDADALWGVYDELLRALWDSVSTPRLMRWTRADGAALQCYVKIGEAFDPVLRAVDAGRVLAYQLVFDRDDPLNYSQTLTVVAGDTLTVVGGGWVFPATFDIIFTPSGAATTLATNNGTVETPAVFTIHGAVSDPRILQVQTGKVIVLSGSIAPGSRIIVDGAARTVLLDGVTDRSNLVDFAATDWAAALIPPGGCTYRLLATTWDATARLDVASRDAYA
jgi:hypothetical protein